MIKVRKLIDEIYQLETELPLVAPSQFTVYLIKESQGIVIDPGPAILVPQIQEAMVKVGIKDLSHIIPTHIHIDHAGAMGRLAQLYPGATVIVHPAGKKHVIDPSRLIESTKTVFGPDFETALGSLIPVPESRLKTVEDGEVIRVGGRELQFVHTPGHAPHQIAILDRSVNGLFSGEALGLPGNGDMPLTMAAVAPPAFDQDVYLETMEKLRKLKAKLIFYSHGGMAKEPDKLISIAQENTRLVGELVRRALKSGESDEDVKRKLKQAAKSRFDVELSDMDVTMIVGGYTMYYRKKGLD
ncbi:MAG: MBL fold metallo-hydrolase [Chloroflexi bacterium]|nr:MBL fold metallo-hydrolase [Chloroflexota bacterium]